MFGRIGTSWELVKASYRVLKADKELIIFPIVSLIGIIIVSISFLVPMALSGLLEALVAEETNSTRILSFVMTFLFYVIVYTVTIFANSALVGAAMIRLRGGDPTVRDGFRIAGERIGSILIYAVISATVGMILRAISERGGAVGHIASSFIGLAWNLATFLVIPILVIEDISPVDAIKRSGSLLKQTWGEQIIGDMSIGLIFGLLSVVIIVPGAALVMAAASVSTLLAIVLGIVIGLIVVSINLVGSALSGIYRAALYQYAVEGQTSDYFEEAMIRGAFRDKPQRSFM